MCIMYIMPVHLIQSEHDSEEAKAAWLELLSERKISRTMVGDHYPIHYNIAHLSNQQQLQHSMLKGSSH